MAGEIDLVSYGGLKPTLDDDIRRRAVPLERLLELAESATDDKYSKAAHATTPPWPLTTAPSRPHHDAEIETTHLMHAVSGAASTHIVVTK